MTSKKLVFILLLAFTIPVFAQEPDMSLIPYRQGDLWGYASPDKHIVIKPEYTEASLFSQGFASVKKGGKYGYINKEGKVVIPFKFYSAKPFRIGYLDVSAANKTGDGKLVAQKTVLFAGAAPKADGYEICIDTKGQNLKCPAINESSAPDINKPTTVTVESNYSTIQKSDLFDKIIADYKIVAGADDTYYIATRNNNYGVFNNKFDVIVPFQYTKIEKLNIGAMVYLLAEKDGMKGILFGNGSPYMAVDNSKLNYIHAIDGNSYFIFTKDGKTGVKSTKYNNLVEPVYSEIMYDSTGGFILTGSDNLKGYYFSNGITIQPQYAEIKALKGGEYIMVKAVTGKWGYVSNKSVEYFEDTKVEKGGIK